MITNLRIDTREIAAVERAIRLAGRKAPTAIRLAINRAGDQATTQVTRALTTQTGLKRKVIVKALKRRRASIGSMSYELKSRGGNISLKYFGARETGKGVSAAPWGKRKVFSGTFMKGGLFPKRVPLNLSGHVFARSGAGRLPIGKRKSGLYIPTEMVEGVSAAAFTATVASVLPARLAHELFRILGK